MDVNNLISEIFLRPALWDKTDKNHHNRFVLDKMWSEVAQKTQTSQNVARGKWKNLRDKFRITLASIPKPKSGDPQVNDYRGEWKYFTSLLFLKDRFTPRKASGNLGDPKAHTLEDDKEDHYDKEEHHDKEDHHYNSEEADVGSLLSEETSRSVTPTSSSSIIKTKNAKQSVGTALLQIEREKLEYLQSKRARKEDDDEDLNFFKSLLPHVKKLSSFDKMEYRMKVMKITRELMSPRTVTFTPQNIDLDDYNLPCSSNKSTGTKCYYDNVNMTLDEQQQSQLDSSEYTNL